MLFRSNATLDTHVGNILKIGPDEIEHKTSCTFVGIIFDNQLRWNDHINYINVNISRSVYILKHVFPSNLLKTLLYNGTAVSYVWHYFVGFDLPMLYSKTCLSGHLSIVDKTPSPTGVHYGQVLLY